MQSSTLVYTIGHSILKIVFIAIAELLFVFFVLKSILTDNGDTMLIEIIKNIENEKNSKLIHEYYYNLKIKDIDTLVDGGTVLKADKVGTIKEYNKLKRGYIKVNADCYSDISFTGDVGFADDLSDDATEVTLHVKQYQYKGFKVLGSHIINKFVLENENNLEKEIEHPTTNTYIARLAKRKVFDYPISLASDLKDGLSKSKIFIVIITFALSIIIGIYGFYRGASTRDFLSNFEVVGTESGVTIQTDNKQKYEKYKVYVQDAIAMLPKELTEEFISDGWTLVFTDDDLASYPVISSAIDENTVSGCTFPFYKLTVIQLPETKNVATAQFFLETIVHEYGHYLALKTNALNEDWDAIYNAERKRYTNPYALTNASEGFACCFADYILSEESLKTLTENTYNYINKVIQEFINK